MCIRDRGNSNVTLNYALGTGVQYKKYTKTGNTWGEWTTYNAGETITSVSYTHLTAS